MKALSPLYEEWNARINVISRKDLPHLYEKHVLHSLSIARIFPFPACTTVMDIGTGGGFPGIPLAIVFPEVNFYMVDSIGKKIKVVDAVADALQLSNVTTAHVRAEQDKQGPFDYIVTRAVAPLKKLCTWALPHLKRNTEQDPAPALLCLKGGDLSEEIAISRQHPDMYKINDYFEEPYFLEKYLLVIEK